MKKFITILLILLTVTACGGSDKENSEPAKNKISFEAYINEGETFEFTLDPEEAITYQELREAITETEISVSNWKDYFDIKEVYREHYEYDDDGNKTKSYMAGNIIMTVLNDEYVYVDNRSRNSLEWKVFIDGQESRLMTNNGKTYDQTVRTYNEVLDFSGADSMLIMTDFINSWDEITQEKYEGYLNSYEMISCSGNVKLLDSSLIEYKHLKDNIYYFASYESQDNFYVIFVESEDGNIQRENEYNVAVYETYYGEVQKGLSSINLPLWQAYIDLMKKVNDD